MGLDIVREDFSAKRSAVQPGGSDEAGPGHIHPPTAVELLAERVDRIPETQRHGRYRQLLPTSQPGPGQQYAFDVDLDRCSGCKACLAACHAWNGLDERESWREVGLLVGGGPDQAYLQHVTTACHHCLEPACQVACPVNAYRKDPVTGVVIHLDDQCFGCRYCTLACPYDVPKYHSGLGTVRKCDMCHVRLAAGQAPACVQACPHEAIAIRVVNVSEIVEEHEVQTFLPGAPDPRITHPTTIYTTRKPLPRNLLPADYHQLRPAEAHWPLVVMLVLTQMSVGTLVGSQLLTAWWAPAHGLIFAACTASWSLAMGLAAVGASVLHLGRPGLCFRAVLGLSHSWLSREIVAFAVFGFLSLAHAVGVYLADALWPSMAIPGNRWLGWAAAMAGVLAVVCSAMVYAATKREVWNGPGTTARFLGSTVLLGSVTVWFLMEVTVPGESREILPLISSSRHVLAWVCVGCTIGKLAIEFSALRYLGQRHASPQKGSAQLLVGHLADVTLARLACGLAGGLMLPALMLGSALMEELGPRRILPLLALVLAVVAGEVLERFLFFRACVWRRMPGAVQA